MICDTCRYKAGIVQENYVDKYGTVQVRDCGIRCSELGFSVPFGLVDCNSYKEKSADEGNSSWQ